MVGREGPRKHRSGGHRCDHAGSDAEDSLRIRIRYKRAIPSETTAQSSQSPRENDGHEPGTIDDSECCPGTDRYTGLADRLPRPSGARLIHVNPNAVSCRFFAAVGAGFAFYLVRRIPRHRRSSDPRQLLFDALTERRENAGKRPPGDFLDHVLDRYADVFMLGGVAFNAMLLPLVDRDARPAWVLLTSTGTKRRPSVRAAHRRSLGRADRLVSCSWWTHPSVHRAFRRRDPRAGPVAFSR